MKLESLNDLYLEQLKDLYSAETQIVDALPKMAEAASSPELKKGFNDHLRQTEEHVRRLERIFEGLQEKAKGHTCEAMKGLLKEGAEMTKMKGEPAVIDAGLIACAQRVEHYEIAGYGTVRTFARQLGKNDHVALLDKTLLEEKQTDEKLTTLAESHVNQEAGVGSR
jgi:ferritin-like metal-binding protein YciE